MVSIRIYISIVSCVSGSNQICSIVYSKCRELLSFISNRLRPDTAFVKPFPEYSKLDMVDDLNFFCQKWYFYFMNYYRYIPNKLHRDLRTVLLDKYCSPITTFIDLPVTLTGSMLAELLTWTPFLTDTLISFQPLLSPGK